MKAAFSKLLWSLPCALLAFTPSFGGSLPSGYTQLAYIQGDGSTSEIVTDFTPNPTTDRIEADVEFVNKDKDFMAIWCARGASGTQGTYTLFYGKTCMRFDHYWENAHPGAQMNFLEGNLQVGRYLFVADKNKVYSSFNGGELVLGGEQTFYSGFTGAWGPLTIFYSYMGDTGNSKGNYGNHKLYSFKIYRSGSLIHDYVPCKDGTGKAMLVDVCDNPSTITCSGTIIPGEDGPEPPVPPTPGTLDTVWVDGSWTGEEEGTEAKPCKTIAKAFEMVNAGGTIYVKAGTYAPMTQNITGGSKEVTVAGAPGTTRGEVVLSGGGTARVLETKNVILHLVGLTVANGYLQTQDGNNGAAWKINNADAATAVTASNCVFTGNQATGGGAFFVGLNNTLALYDCEVSDNTTAKYEGAIRLYHGSGLIAHRCTFLNNVAAGANSGHVIHFSKNDGADYGACDIRNCIFKGNGSRAASGNNAKALVYGSECKASATVVESCTFVGNGVCSGNMLLLPSGATVRNCLFADNTVGGSEIASLSSAVSGPSTANSLCVTKAGAKFEQDGLTPQGTWFTVIDRGADQGWMTGATDAAGLPRIVGEHVDIGAYECQDPQPPPQPVEGALYVDYNYTGESDGTMEKPFKSLGAAVTALGGAGGKILLAAGTHRPGATVNLSADAGDIIIAGVPGTTRDEVILDGGGSIQIMTLTGGFTLAGLTFQNAGNPKFITGGAVHFNESSGQGVVSNCVFKSNNISGGSGGNGGALYTKAPLTVVDTVFDSNKSAWEGGALYQEGTALMTVDRCRFLNNLCKDSADIYGNAINANGGSLVLRNSYFEGNGTYKGTGNGDYCVYSVGVASISCCTFKRNGGKGTTIITKQPGSSTVDNCLFVDNTKSTAVITSMSDAVSGATTDDSSRCFTAAQAQFESDGVTPQKDWAEVINKGVKKDWMTGAKDLLGRARVSGGRVDIGAVERQFFSGLKLLFR